MRGRLNNHTNRLIIAGNTRLRRKSTGSRPLGVIFTQAHDHELRKSSTLFCRMQIPNPCRGFFRISPAYWPCPTVGGGYFCRAFTVAFEAHPRPLARIPDAAGQRAFGIRVAKEIPVFGVSRNPALLCEVRGDCKIAPGG